jgi:2-polyprenyl-6-methoxyphenol hydroxylase-like FAD-dependent oxidoreductase
MERTQCAIAGGGPAGMVLGLLLARAGVEVTVLEKHGDFLRDFRGDTVHPSTLSLLDELGLGERFAQLPQRRVDRVQIPLGPDDEMFTISDFNLLPIKHNYIALVPQWDLLDLLADAAEQEPNFTLRMNTEVTGFLREGGRINGVHYRTAEGATGELRATITAACDGRRSAVRELPELDLRTFPCPMDAWWFRLPRHESDPQGLVANVGRRMFIASIDRGDFWQCAGIIRKGTDPQRRAAGLQAFLDELAEAAPWLADGRDSVTSWDEVKLLDVKLDRLHRWHRPGLLCLGDAAHAMSPLGGIGINLAVQDAVAAARNLADPLRRTGRVDLRDVQKIQARRMPTTVATQGLQRILHRRVVEPILDGEISTADPARPPAMLRAISRAPWLRRVPAYFLAYGAVPEHPPAAALRS